MDTLMQILGSLFPAGLGAAIGTAVGWFFNRRLSKARNGGDIDAAYMDNIQNLRSDLLNSINENRKLYRAIARLDRTVARATTCRHWNDCPVRDELQKSGQDDDHPSSERQSAKRKTIRSDPPARSGQRGADEVTDEPTGHIAGRRGI
jgi:hypothetical protein